MPGDSDQRPAFRLFAFGQPEGNGWSGQQENAIDPVGQAPVQMAGQDCLHSALVRQGQEPGSRLGFHVEVITSRLIHRLEERRMMLQQEGGQRGRLSQLLLQAIFHEGVMVMSFRIGVSPSPHSFSAKGWLIPSSP